jgi:hydroxyacylglutathione hydrolase
MENVTLGAILNTHHHRDHTGGNAGILSRAQVDVFGHKNDKDRIPGMTRPVDEGDEIAIAGLKAHVLFIPGHTAGHIAYLFGKNLFCGDTLFTAGCGRLFEGTAEQMHASLAKLMRLPDDTLVYCGHEYTEKNLEFALSIEPGNPKISERLNHTRALRARGQPTVPSTIAEEKATNPFLRWESREIQNNLKKQSPDLALNPVSVFAEIRRLKDNF